MTTERPQCTARHQRAACVTMVLLCSALLAACDTGSRSPGAAAVDTAGTVPGPDTAPGSATTDGESRDSPRGAEQKPGGALPAPGDTAEITVIFSRGESTVAVQRTAPEDMPQLEAALRALLRGPTDAERAAGIQSWFSDATAGALRSAEVDDAGHAVVDFADLRQLIPNASTSAGSAMLLRELNGTVFAVPGVRAVEYRLDGSCEAFWEWLQYGGCRVQQRS